MLLYVFTIGGQLGDTSKLIGGQWGTCVFEFIFSIRKPAIKCIAGFFLILLILTIELSYKIDKF